MLYDLVPEPKILDKVLRASRRLNDLASAIRVLEAFKVSDTAFPGLLGVCLNCFCASEALQLRNGLRKIKGKTDSKI